VGLDTSAAISLQLALGLLTHVYLGRSRVGSCSAASWIGTEVLLTSIPLGMILSVTPGFPIGVALLAPPLALTFMAASRWLSPIAHVSVEPAVTRVRPRRSSTGSAEAEVHHRLYCG